MRITCLIQNTHSVQIGTIQALRSRKRKPGDGRTKVQD